VWLSASRKHQTKYLNSSLKINLVKKPNLLQKIHRPYSLPKLPPDRYYQELPDPELAGDGALVIIDDSDDFDSYVYRLSNVLYQGKTKFQNVLIGDTYNWGRILVLDGAIQSAEDDESLYHEMLVQPAMLAHPKPENVLIVGGGEGATLREVLVHGSVKSATMVDIDREVVELCRKHLVSWHRGAFDDSRVRLVYQDGRKFIEKNHERYDVVIIDIVDMLDNGPAQSLYTKQFYQMLRKRLSPRGIVVIQGLEFSFLDDKEHAALFRTLRTVFSEVHSYRTDIPSFLSSWGFLMASDWFQPHKWKPEQIDRVIKQRLGTEWLDHITGDFLKSTFSLCKETLFMLGLSGPILEDGVEFVLPPDIEDNESPTMKFPILPRKKT